MSGDIVSCSLSPVPHDTKAPSGPGPAHFFRLHDHAQTHHTQKILPDNTQHSQETDIMPLAGFKPAIPASKWM